MSNNCYYICDPVPSYKVSDTVAEVDAPMYILEFQNDQDIVVPMNEVHNKYHSEPNRQGDEIDDEGDWEGIVFELVHLHCCIFKVENSKTTQRIWK